MLLNHFNMISKSVVYTRRSIVLRTTTSVAIERSSLLVAHMADMLGKRVRSRWKIIGGVIWSTGGILNFRSMRKAPLVDLFFDLDREFWEVTETIHYTCGQT
jgi:hypothetical protein